MYIKASGHNILHEYTAVVYIVYRVFFGGEKFSGKTRNLGYFVEKVSWSCGINHTPIHTTRRFVGKYFVVRLSTTKTTKILPLENYPLYGTQSKQVMVKTSSISNAYIYIYILLEYMKSHPITVSELSLSHIYNNNAKLPQQSLYREVVLTL